MHVQWACPHFEHLRTPVVKDLRERITMGTLKPCTAVNGIILNSDNDFDFVDFHLSMANIWMEYRDNETISMPERAGAADEDPPPDHGDDDDQAPDIPFDNQADDENGNGQDEPMNPPAPEPQDLDDMEPAQRRNPVVLNELAEECMLDDLMSDYEFNFSGDSDRSPDGNEPDTDGSDDQAEVEIEPDVGLEDVLLQHEELPEDLQGKPEYNTAGERKRERDGLANVKMKEVIEVDDWVPLAKAKPGMFAAMQRTLLRPHMKCKTVTEDKRFYWKCVACDRRIMCPKAGQPETKIRTAMSREPCLPHRTFWKDLLHWCEIDSEKMKNQIRNNIRQHHQHCVRWREEMKKTGGVRKFRINQWVTVDQPHRRTSTHSWVDEFFEEMEQHAEETIAFLENERNAKLSVNGLREMWKHYRKLYIQRHNDLWPTLNVCPIAVDNDMTQHAADLETKLVTCERCHKITGFSMIRGGSSIPPHRCIGTGRSCHANVQELKQWQAKDLTELRESIQRDQHPNRKALMQKLLKVKQDLYSRSPITSQAKFPEVHLSGSLLKSAVEFHKRNRDGTTTKRQWLKNWEEFNRTSKRKMKTDPGRLYMAFASSAPILYARAETPYN